MDILMADDGAFYYNIKGIAEGTSYNILYQDDEGRDFSSGIEDLLMRFEKSLSVYDESSIISKINRNESTVVDEFFTTVFNKAKAISSFTEGAFDISAEPLFRAWGFSSHERSIPDEEQVKALKKSIGMNKISIIDGQVVKTDPDLILNVNAIAKGYSVDIVANLLDENACPSYLVEIGGEIRLKGSNPEGEAWRIGIDRPSDDRLRPGEEIQVVLQLTDKAIATSGNYRQFYIDNNGYKMGHTINPATGYPTNHNLLSVTVIMDDSMSADAFATAFLVVGIDKAVDWIVQRTDIEALFICDEEGEYKVYYTAGMEDYILADNHTDIC